MGDSGIALRILGCHGVPKTCFEAPGVSLGVSGVSIGGVRILRVGGFGGLVFLFVFGGLLCGQDTGGKFMSQYISQHSGSRVDTGKKSFKIYFKHLQYDKLNIPTVSTSLHII